MYKYINVISLKCIIYQSFDKIVILSRYAIAITNFWNQLLFLQLFDGNVNLTETIFHRTKWNCQSKTYFQKGRVSK